MQGKITVVPSTTPVASPAAQFAVGQKQLAKDEAGLVTPAKLLAQGKPPIPGVTLPGSNPVLVGSGNPGSSDPGQIDQFGPRTVHIPVGGSVTWWLVGLHSITFNSTRVDNDVQAVYNERGCPVEREGRRTQVGGPGAAVEASHGRDAEPHQLQGPFASQSGKRPGDSTTLGCSGTSQPPNIEGYKLTFTHAGTYKFICTVHDRHGGGQSSSEAVETDLLEEHLQLAGREPPGVLRPALLGAASLLLLVAAIRGCGGAHHAVVATTNHRVASGLVRTRSSSRFRASRTSRCNRHFRPAVQPAPRRPGAS